MQRCVWSVEEIGRVLLALNQTSGSAAAAIDAPDAARLVAYREGFKAALAAVATALGVGQQEEAK